MRNRQSFLITTIFILAFVFSNGISAQTPSTDSDQELTYFESLNERLKKNPDDKEALALRSDTYALIGDEASAIIDLTKLISLEPDSAGLYLRRAGLYLIEKNYLKVISDASKSIEIDSSSPSVANAYFIRGTANLLVTLDSGKKAESLLPDFNKAIAINPEYADFYVNRGVAYFLEGDSPKALADFDKATELGSEKTDLISFFRERAKIITNTDGRANNLAGQYFFLMGNLRQKSLQTVAAVKFSDQTIRPVKAAKNNTARRQAAQKSYQAHLKSERFIVASLAEVAKIRRLPFKKDEWERIRKAESASKLPNIIKIQSALNTTLAIVRRNISLLKMLR
jgi:tetratricopeptide (TPR) repeat protein